MCDSLCVYHTQQKQATKAAAQQGACQAAAKKLCDLEPAELCSGATCSQLSSLSPQSRSCPNPTLAQATTHEMRAWEHSGDNVELAAGADIKHE